MVLTMRDVVDAGYWRGTVASFPGQLRMGSCMSELGIDDSATSTRKTNVRLYQNACSALLVLHPPCLVFSTAPVSPTPTNLSPVIMPFLAEEDISIPNQDLLSWMFDNQTYDQDAPVSDQLCSVGTTVSDD